jgi:hypothetical protein
MGSALDQKVSCLQLLDGNTWKVYLKAGCDSFLHILLNFIFKAILRFDFCSVPRRLTHLNACTDLEMFSTALSSRYSAICSSVRACNIWSHVYTLYIYMNGPSSLSKRCPTRYRTRHFFNNFTANEGIATKFEATLPHCVRNVKEKNVLLFKFRCNIFICVRIIKETPGSVVSGNTLLK